MLLTNLLFAPDFLFTANRAKTRCLSGRYFHPQVIECEPNALATPALGERVWRFSEQLVQTRGLAGAYA